MNSRSTNTTRKPSRAIHRNCVSHSYGQRRLRFEPLEDRRLLATLEMGFVFRHVDADGEPGTVMTEPATTAEGSDFWVELRVKDSRASATSPAPGVIALPVTVNWGVSSNNGSLTNHNRIQYTGLAPVPGPNPASLVVLQNNPLITQKFPLQRFVDTDGSTGNFSNLRGGVLPNAGQGAPIGTTEPEAFSQMKFVAHPLENDQPVTVCFDAALVGSMSFADADVLEGVDSQRGCITIVSEPRLSSLSGFVYLDANNDGIRNVDPNGVPLEIGLPSVTIHLDLYNQGEPTLLRTVDTGPGGWYSFEDLKAGVYRIRQEQPAAFLDGKDTLGIVLPGGESRGEVGDGEFTNIRLNAGEHGIDYNFGERTANVNKRMFLASTPKPREIVGSRQGVPTKVIEVASANVTVEPKVEEQAFQVIVNNGSAQSIPFTQARIVSVEDPTSASTVTLIGTPAPDTAYTAPGYAVLRRADVPITQGYGMEVVGAPTIWIDAGSGQNDRIVMQDSPRSDAFVAGDPTPGGPPPAVPAQTASLGIQAPANEPGMQVFARRFHRVRAISSSGGTDQATQHAHDMALQLVGNWNP